MEKPVIYTQTIHTPAESRSADVAIRETDTAGQAVAWDVSYRVKYHNAKPYTTQSTEVNDTYFVSTHSRPKAAGRRNPWEERWTKCFNSQPPEGGW